MPRPSTGICAGVRQTSTPRHYSQNSRPRRYQSSSTLVLLDRRTSDVLDHPVNQVPVTAQSPRLLDDAHVVGLVSGVVELRILRAIAVHPVPPHRDIADRVIHQRGHLCQRRLAAGANAVTDIGLVGKLRAVSVRVCVLFGAIPSIRR